MGLAAPWGRLAPHRDAFKGGSGLRQVGYWLKFWVFSLSGQGSNWAVVGPSGLGVGKSLGYPKCCVAALRFRARRFTRFVCRFR